jgi:hypothetical protein
MGKKLNYDEVKYFIEVEIKEGEDTRNIYPYQLS